MHSVSHKPRREGGFMNSELKFYSREWNNETNYRKRTCALHKL